MAKARKPRYVDIANPSLSVECPRCGLLTARFVDHCRNCGYKIWPSSMMASAAFKAWQAPDPIRLTVSRFDLDLTEEVDATVDYAERAHKLGIHLFPNSNWPIVICLGALFLGLAAIPFDGTVRVVLAVVGGVIFLAGVVGWVLIEDVHMYPADAGHATEVHS